MRLSIEAMGPFAQRQDIDFDRFRESGLFLIEGPTGVGKTSILDALCLALYGESSGAIREPANMASHWTNGVKSWVSLEFTLRGKTYRVVRELAYQREKKKGEGTTEQPETALLEEITEGSARNLASGWKKVSDKCVELLGFNANQFRQVILLPQGQFREFLEAKSQDRELILERLFPIGIYDSIQKELKEKTQALDRQVKIIEQERDTKVQALDRIGISLPDGSASALTAKHGELQADLEESRKLAIAAEAGLKQASVLREQAAALAGLFDMQRKREQDQASLAAKQPVLQALRGQLKVAGLAGQADADHRAWQDANRAFQDVQAAVVLAEKALVKANEALAKAEAAKLIADSSVGKLGELKKQEQALQILKPKAERWVRALQDREKQDLAIKVAQDGVKKAQERVAGLKAEHSKIKAGLDAIEGAAQKRDRLKSELERLEKTKEIIGTLKVKQHELKVLQSNFKEQAKALANAHNTVERAETDLEAARSAAVSLQASVLAQGLKEGAACPVCGSTTHPHKNIAPAKVETPLDLEGLREARDQAKAEEVKIAEVEKKVSNRMAKTESAVETLEKSLGDQTKEGLLAFQKSLGETQTALEKAEADVLSQATLKQQLAALEMNLAKHETVADSVKKQEELVGKAFASASATLVEVEADLPIDYRKAGTIEAKLAGLSAEATALQGAINIAVVAHAEALGEQIKAQANQQGALRNLGDFEIKLISAAKGLEEKLSSLGFKGRDSYFSAQKTLEWIRTTEKQITDFDMQWAASEAQLADANVAVRGKQAPDLPGAQRVEQELAGVNSLAQAKATQKAQTLENFTALAEDLVGMAARLEVVRQDWRLHSRLADWANAVSPNTSGVSFKRFVLSVFLDRVLERASEKLASMTQSRYTLSRTDNKLAGNLAGLDIMVNDRSTGLARPASTLSGGEGFMSAMALALGLADEVMSRTGGRQLDSLFIDEGFGSLDPAALGEAIKLLGHLQRSGRLIGVISHVEDMKTHITSQLVTTHVF